jgi:anti-sigma factor RsiW
MTDQPDTTARPLSCREFVGLVTPWLDDALSPTDRDRVVAHLADCDDCTVHIDQVRTTIGHLRRLRDDPLDERTRASLLAVLPPL